MGLWFNNRQGKTLFLSECVTLFCFSSALYAEQLSLKQAELEGHFIQGSLALGKLSPDNKIFFNGQSIHVSPQKSVALYRNNLMH